MELCLSACTRSRGAVSQCVPVPGTTLSAPPETLRYDITGEEHLSYLSLGGQVHPLFPSAQLSRPPSFIVFPVVTWCNPGTVSRETFKNVYFCVGNTRHLLPSLFQPKLFLAQLVLKLQQ